MIYTFIVSVSDPFQFFQEDMLIYPWWYMKKVNLKLLKSCLSIWNSEFWFLDMIRIYLSDFLCRCADSSMIFCLCFNVKIIFMIFNRVLYIFLPFCDFGKIRLYFDLFKNTTFPIELITFHLEKQWKVSLIHWMERSKSHLTVCSFNVHLQALLFRICWSLVIFLNAHIGISSFTS